MGSLARAALALATSVACSPQLVDAVERCRGADCNTVGGAAGGAGAPAVGRVSLIHRYSFNPSSDGVEVIDSMGGESGRLVNVGYGVDGTVKLAGLASDQYVDLPNHLLDGLASVTFESWVSWDGGEASWQRIFDFGEDDTGVDGSRSGQPRSYLFLTCTPSLRLVFEQPPARSPEIIVDANVMLPVGQWTHVAAVVDESAQRMALYMDGIERGATRFTRTLQDVYDVNNWLGRSQYALDAGFAGSITEFRLYAGALDATAVKRSFDAGPNALPAP